MSSPPTTNPYQFWNQLKKEMEQETGKEELEVERSVQFNLRLIWKLEKEGKSNRKVVEFRKYLELLNREVRSLPEEQTLKIKRLFFYLMNQKKSKRTRFTEREKRFSRYNADIRTSKIRFKDSDPLN